MTQRTRTQSLAGEARSRQSGYSLVEALIVVAIGLILTTVSVVMVQSALRTYTVNSAANNVSRSIGVIRYTAITQGSNACTLFLNNQFGIDPDCNGAFTTTDQRVQIPAGVTLGIAVPSGVTTTGMPFSPLPTLMAGCGTVRVTFNTRGSKTAVCGTVTGGAVTNVFFLSDNFGNSTAVTVTGTGRARSWRFVNGAWN